MLHPADIERIAARTAELIRANLEPMLAISVNPVIPLDQAVKFVGKTSDSAFYRWCALWRVKPCSSGRYAVGDLRAGMVREAKGVFQRRRVLA